MEDNQGCFIGFIIICAIIGLCVAFPIFLTIGLIIIGLITLGIIIAFLSHKKKNNKRRNQSISTGVTVGMVDDYISDYEKKIQSLRQNIYKLEDETIQNELDTATLKMRKILTILKKDPADFKKTRRFLDNLLPSVKQIVSQSVQLYSSNDFLLIEDKTVDNLRSGFSLINQACDNHIKKMYDNNLMDLDIELTMLNKSLRSRGLLINKSEDLQ